MKKLFWGDLHNHNEIGYGKGSLKRSYEIAQGCLLDFYAFTPHGSWLDIPQNAPKVAEYHKHGFERVLQQWAQVEKMAAKEDNKQFISFIAGEWHSSNCGDYCVIFPSSEAEPIIAENLQDLKKLVKRNKAIMIPHHLAYKQGWRGINWDLFDSELSPVVEVFSEHAASMEAVTPWPMQLHSMGGACKSQTALEQLKRGKRFGVIASTDNHFGHPGSYGEGLVAVWAEDLSREAVFDSLKARHCYAVTGDRISLEFFANEGMMGDTISQNENIKIKGNVVACGAIEFVQVLKNGLPAETIIPTPAASDNNPVCTLDLDFGWGKMGSGDVVKWKIKLSLDKGKITGINPRLCGGASTDLINKIEQINNQELIIETFTSRDNAHPVSGISLRLEELQNSSVKVNFEAINNDGEYSGELAAKITDLFHDDCMMAVSDSFSAPKIRLGQACCKADTDCSFEWNDHNSKSGDFYMLKVQQKNGHIAWSSPIWVN
jgi:Protein of unknown function (DUF3604)